MVIVCFVKVIKAKIVVHVNCRATQGLLIWDVHIY